MEKALDFFGNEIRVGDEVAFMQTGYRHFIKGKIEKITSQNVIISHNETNVCKKQTKQFHNQVIRNI
jgi:peroxiredoxin